MAPRRAKRALRVLVVDDQPGVRVRIRELLADLRPDLEVLEAGSAGAALRRIDAGGIDLVLLDLRMPGTGGMEALRRIVAGRPALPVVVVSGQPEVPYGAAARRAGAAAFVPKQALPGGLLRVLRRLLPTAAPPKP